MMRMLTAAAAALILAACGQGMLGGGVPIPNTPDGMQEPSKLEGAPPAQQADITDEQRTQFEGQVRGYLDGVQGQIGGLPAEGFEDVMIGMQPNTDHRYYLDLVAGTAYRIVGACDQDCTNIDFELIAPGGGVVASDLLPDDFPIVDFTPTANGRYIGRVIMRACSVAPCFTGVRVLTPPPAETAGVQAPAEDK